MNNEKYNKIIDKVYENYHQENKQVMYLTFLLKEEFINKIKTDKKFSERWGLKIEEHELSEERRYNIWFNNNYETGMERFFNPEDLPDYDNPYYEPTPKKLIIVNYMDEKIEGYE